MADACKRCKSWEETVDAMLDAIPDSRRGLDSENAAEEVEAAVQSYEEEIDRLRNHRGSGGCGWGLQ